MFSNSKENPQNQKNILGLKLKDPKMLLDCILNKSQQQTW